VALGVLGDAGATHGFLDRALGDGLVQVMAAPLTGLAVEVGWR